MNAIPGNLIFKDVQRRFDRCANGFDDADFVHRATFDGIVDRLAPVSTTPSIILDLGSATGKGSRKLDKMYRQARVVSLDASIQMLRAAKRRRSFLHKSGELQGNALQIPLRTGSVDLVIANLLLPWIVDLPACLGEVARVLRKDGVFAFSLLGPDSFSEIRSAWRTQDEDWHVNAFPDMHDIGDLVMRSALRDPVLDVDTLSVTYPDTQALYRDLSNCGARNSLAARCRTLTGKDRFGRMEEALLGQFDAGSLRLDLELVYGHAWGGGPVAKSGEFHLDAGSIPRRQR